KGHASNFVPCSSLPHDRCALCTISVIASTRNNIPAIGTKGHRRHIAIIDHVSDFVSGGSLPHAGRALCATPRLINVFTPTRCHILAIGAEDHRRHRTIKGHASNFIRRGSLPHAGRTLCTTPRLINVFTSARCHILAIGAKGHRGHITVMVIWVISFPVAASHTMAVPWL